jgi:hypothetical protein
LNPPELIEVHTNKSTHHDADIANTAFGRSISEREPDGAS